MDQICFEMEATCKHGDENVPVIAHEMGSLLSQCNPADFHRIIACLLVILENGPKGVAESIATRGPMLVQSGALGPILRDMNSQNPDDVALRLFARLVSSDQAVAMQAMKMGAGAALAQIISSAEEDLTLAWGFEAVHQLGQYKTVLEELVASKLANTMAIKMVFSHPLSFRVATDFVLPSSDGQCHVKEGRRGSQTITCLHGLIYHVTVI